MNIFNRVVNKLRFKQDNSVLNKFKNMFKLKSLSSKFILGFVVLFFIATAFFVVHGQMGTSTSSGPSLTKGLIAHYTLDARDYEEGTENMLNNSDGKLVNSLYGVPGSYQTGWDSELHNDAIVVQNWSVGYNSGVGSANIGYHAKWVYEGIDGDNDPCIKFIDKNNLYGLGHRWLGISQNIGTPTSLGLNIGDVVTISWWQKSDVNNKGANVGLYHKTLSTGGYSFESNIKYVSVNNVNIWERASFSTTITDNWDLNANVHFYIYGERGNYGTLWVDNIQLEKKPHATDFVKKNRVDRVIDKSAYSNHGTNYGATPSTDRHGREGGAMSFDGNSNRIQISYKNPVNQTSVVAWFKRNGSPAGGYHIIVGGSNVEISIPDSSGQIRTGVTTNTQGRRVFNSGSGLNDGNWHQVALTYDGSNLKSYIDGELTATNSVSGNLNGIASEIGRYLSNSYVANGLIDDVRIYDRALSEEEISLLYGSYAPKIKTSSINSGLIGHWTLSEEDYNHSTNRVTDKTPYENHGTNYGASFTTDRHGNEGGAMNFGPSYPNSIDMPYGMGLNVENISISMWVKPNTTSGSPIFFASNNGNNQRLYLSIFGGKWDIGIRENVWNTSLSNTIATTNWTHILLNMSGGIATLYVNGEYSMSKNYSPYSLASDFRLGRHRTESSSFQFNGSIDDVRIYNRALSEEEINLLYNSYSPKTGGDSLKKGLVLDIPLTSSSIKSGSAGSEILADMTPYGNDGQNFGSVIDTNYTTLNGNSSYIRINNSDSIHNKAFGLSNNFTISAWAYPISWANWATIINKANGGFFSNTLNGLWASNSPTGFACVMGSGVNNNPGGSVINTSYNPGLNKWSHVVCSADGNNLKIYVDGVYRGGVSISGLTHPRTELADPVVIGRRSVSSGPSFNGHISNIKAYNRALSEDEISLLYYQGAASLGGILTE